METNYQISFRIPAYLLNDLCTRFIVNMPKEESQDIIRVFFQIELAHWFYLDFYCPDSTEFRAVSLKEFAIQIFQHCPALVPHLPDFNSFLAQFKEYKQAVPTYGAILLDPTLQHCLLVQGYYVKASWGFPKGKINQDEAKVNCAIREVLEETGYDIRGLIDEDRYLERMLNETPNRLYIIPGVPMDTLFNPKTRQEIKNFSWFRIDRLPSHKKDQICKQHYNLNPNQFFMVIPFIRHLRQWIQSASSSIHHATALTFCAPSPQSSGTISCPIPRAIAQRDDGVQSIRRMCANFGEGGGGGNGGVGLRVPVDERRRKPQRSPNAISESEDFGPDSQDTLGVATSLEPGHSFKTRTQSESPTCRLNSGMKVHGKGSSPMNPGKRGVANKSTSPTKGGPIKTRPIVILSRDHSTATAGTKDNVVSTLGIKTQRERKKPPKAHEMLSHPGLPTGRHLVSSDDRTSAAPEPSNQLIDADYICPAWRNFRLDIDAIMSAMFPIPQQQQSSMRVT